MSTEDTPKPAASQLTEREIAHFMLKVDDPILWGRLGSKSVVVQFARAIEAAAVAAANTRWESAIGAVMPADFKCWHQNAKSELPEIAAGVIENLRQQATDAWEQEAAAAAKERERLRALVEVVRDANCDAEDVNTFRLLKPGQERAWLALMAGLN